METGNIVFNRAVYLQTSINEPQRIINYNIKEGSKLEKDTLFTEVIRLEFDNGYHDRSRYFDYWLYFRNDTNWKRCLHTGLANTKIKNVLEGNISRCINLSVKTDKGKNFETPQHLIIAQSNNLKSYLIIDIFKDFYIPKKTVLNHFINEHYINHMITKKELLTSSLNCSNVCNNGQC